MSEMLERVAKAIQEVLEKPKYVVKISKVWECWDVQENKLIDAFEVHSHINNLCDRLNTLYIARKAVEALKITEKEFNIFLNDKDIKELAMWNTNIDAVLK